METIQNKTIQLILWSLIMLSIILIAMITFRIVSRKLQRERISNNIKQNNDLRAPLELLKEATREISVPPILLFNIKKENAKDLGIELNETKILERKTFFGYRYYIISFPCIFYFFSKTNIDYKNKISIESTFNLNLLRMM